MIVSLGGQEARDVSENSRIDMTIGCWDTSWVAFVLVCFNC